MTLVSGGAPMPPEDNLLFGTYRCPVCSHRDGAELSPRQLASRIECSYCGTPLEISASNPNAVQFTAQLAEAPARG
jgi:DNA-directed RNA polymerase subunit RPC12/RpoP